MKIDLTQNELESLLSLVKLSICCAKDNYGRSNSVYDLDSVIEMESIEIKLCEALNGIRQETLES